MKSASKSHAASDPKTTSGRVHVRPDAGYARQAANGGPPAGSATPDRSDHGAGAASRDGRVSPSRGGLAVPSVSGAAAPFDVQAIRAQFPILHQEVYGKPLVYLDNAATSQKPQSVLDAILHFYTHDNSNVHRGLHALSQRATQSFEDARVKIQRFIGASDPSEIIFTRGTTEGVNLVVQTYARAHVGPGDEILVTAMEHHSNIVPWPLLCEERGARLRVAPINDAGELELDAFEAMLGPRTRFVSVVHLSNALGTINPVEAIVAAAHERGIPVLIDGAQAMAHLPVDVQRIGCDFYAFSSHKMYGPTGIGVLYGRRQILESMPPYQGGGDMISSVSFEKTTFNRLPYKFEAGTPDIAGAIGLGAAVDFLRGLDRPAAIAHEAAVTAYAVEQIGKVPGVRLIGTARERSSVVSFIVEGIHPHDVGSVLDQEGIAVRAGHHCTQPLMKRYGVPATTRVSPAVYNTKEEIDAVVKGLGKVMEMFR